MTTPLPSASSSSQSWISGVLQKTASHTLVYGMSVGLMPLTSLVLLPLYTRHLSAEAFGVLALLLVTSGVLAFLYDLGMINALFRRYFEHDADQVQRRQTVVSTAWGFLAGHAALWTIVWLWLAPRLVPAAWQAHVAGGAVPLMLLSTLVTSWTDVPIAALRLRGRVRAFAAVSALRSLALIAATYEFVVLRQRGLAGVFEGQLLAGLGILGLAAWLNRRDYSPQASWSELKAMLAFGMPFFPALLFTWVIDCSDRYFLGLLATLEQVAVYTVGYKLGQIPLLAVKAFMVAWIPLMFSIARAPHAPEAFATVFRYALAGLCLLGLAISLWASELMAVLAPNTYGVGAGIVPLIVLACLGYAVYSFMLSGLLVTRDVWVQPVALGSAAFLNAALNWWTIPRWGMWGAAWATIAAYALAAVATWVAAQRRYPMPVRVGQVALTVGTAALLYGLARGVPLPAAARGIWLLGYVALLWALRIVTPQDWQQVRGLASRASVASPSVALAVK